jgi:transmembrane sensor
MDDYANYTADDFVFDDSFRRWVRQQATDSASPAEQRFWTQYQRTYPEQAVMMAQARQVILALNVPEPDLSAVEIDTLALQTTRQLHQLPAEGQVRSLAWYQQPVGRAAAAVLVFGLGWVAYRTFVDPAPPTVTYQQLLETAGPTLTERHNTTNAALPIKLPDGSRVTLQPGSRLSYSGTLQAFTVDSVRAVYLVGEAFFDVVRNPARPFVVNANETVTRVLGTSFRVKAGAEAGQVTVEVKTGRVAVSVRPELAANVPDQRRNVVLLPNQKAVFSRAETRLARTIVEQPQPLANQSVQTAFEYTDEPVARAFAALQSRYSIPINYDQQAFRNCLITVSLTDEPFTDKLAILCKAVEARYEEVDGKVIVTGKGCE